MSGPGKGFAAAVLCSALVPATAGANVTVGNPAPSTVNAFIKPNSAQVNVQTALPGAVLASPVNGTVVRWSIRGTGMNSDPNVVTLRLLRPAGGEFIGVGSNEQTLPNAASDTLMRSFDTSLPIQQGDQIGLEPAANTSIPLGPSTPGAFREIFNDFSDGASSGAPTSSGIGGELPFNAEVEPTNTFSLSPVVANKRNGTATLTANLPNPGTFEVQGGLIGAQAIDVAAPGNLALTLQPTQQIRKQLKKQGKALVDATFVYAPLFGKHHAQPATFTLKLKRKKKHHRH
jgi:hypothetical protein